jgi:hypothetical protein
VIVYERFSTGGAPGVPGVPGVCCACSGVVATASATSGANPINKIFVMPFTQDSPSFGSRCRSMRVAEAVLLSNPAEHPASISQPDSGPGVTTISGATLCRAADKSGFRSIALPRTLTRTCEHFTNAAQAICKSSAHAAFIKATGSAFMLDGAVPGASGRDPARRPVAAATSDAVCR